MTLHISFTVYFFVKKISAPYNPMDIYTVPFEWVNKTLSPFLSMWLRIIFILGGTAWEESQNKQMVSAQKTLHFFEALSRRGNSLILGYLKPLSDWVYFLIMSVPVTSQK